MSSQWRSAEESRNLLISLGTALIIHGAGLGLWVLVENASAALHSAVLADLNRVRDAARRRAEQQVPTVFVDVSPEQEAPEPPKDTPNYSSRNSVAANPEITADTALPKIEGSQDKMLRTADVLRPQPKPPEPAPAPAPQAEPQPPETAPGVGTPTPPRRRPQTLVEARVQSGLAGKKSTQEGGVRRPGTISLDAKATPYGAYDQALIEAIQKRWYDLLDDSSVAMRSGSVVVLFTLQEDGRITDVHVAEQQDVGEILALYCCKAISDPAPYAPWPPAMRTAIGKNHRVVQVKFFYL